jgi:hypothetical protein
MALLVTVTLSVPQVMPNALELGRSPSAARMLARQEILRATTVEEATRAPSEEALETDLWSRMAAHVGKVRRRFIEMYPNSGSNIDTDVPLNTMADILRYLPRAAMVGFFAPFPNMWLASGKQVGSAGRLLGGLESVVMYAVEALALIGLWRGRRRLSAWFLWSVAAVGMIALGLVVINVGTLYRLRYMFLMLLIILAAEGAAYILDQLSKKALEVVERGGAG